MAGFEVTTEDGFGSTVLLCRRADRFRICSGAGACHGRQTNQNLGPGAAKQAFQTVERAKILSRRLSAPIAVTVAVFSGIGVC
jgi:hypothetical protein